MNDSCSKSNRILPGKKKIYKKKVYGDFYGFQTLGSHGLKMMCTQVKMTILFVIMLICWFLSLK